MKTLFSVMGKVGGATLTIAGVVGVVVTVTYWLDLDDVLVDKMVTAIHKAGKLKALKEAQAAYAAQSAEEDS